MRGGNSFDTKADKRTQTYINREHKSSSHDIINASVVAETMWKKQWNSSTVKCNVFLL
jgi:hypothetical protein